MKYILPCFYYSLKIIITIIIPYKCLQLREGLEAVVASSQGLSDQLSQMGLGGSDHPQGQVLHSLLIQSVRIKTVQLRFH